MSVPILDQPDALHRHLERWREAPFLALDTEFVREETYYPRLCLIQVGDGAHNVCVDPLAALDLTPLYELLEAAHAPRVFHAAGQDLEIFVQQRGRCPGALFDTQIAAALLGHGEQLGYAGLVDKLRGIKLDKSLSRTDWSRRPLQERELAYAADDVRHLADLYPELRAALEQAGRLAWLEEECTRLAQPERYRPAPALEWRRLKGLARLDRIGQHVAGALAAWREGVAEARNRPRRWILSDDALYALAERRPQTAQQLADLQVLPPKSLERHTDALLDCIAQAARNEAPPLALDERASEAEKARLRRVQERARQIAQALDIPASLLASRADLEALCALGAQAPIALLQGWRRAAAGEELLALSR